jgi:hypothetical protein
MAASTDLLTVMAAAGAGAITHAGLVNASGVELSGGGYARIAVTATNTGAVIRLNGDKTFTVPAGATVAGWRGFSASTAGTNYGGGPLPSESYTAAGQYVLEGNNTGFTVTAVAD